MHTSDVLRSHHFHATDAAGKEVRLTDTLTLEDRLGIVSPLYEDAILGGSAAILAFVTAFYDLQRSQQEQTGVPFSVYPDYFVFLFGSSGNVLGQAGPAPLSAQVSRAYGRLDVWPEEKWVTISDAADLWKEVVGHRISHLFLPMRYRSTIGVLPDIVSTGIKAVYRYVLPHEESDEPIVGIALAPQPLDIVAEAVRRLPPESPAHDLELSPFQRVIIN